MLTTLDQIAWAAATGLCKDLQSRLAALQKNQLDARLHSDVMLWIEAERKEVDTSIEKGTYEIVDLPPGVSELDSMFQYKLKTGDQGHVLQRKALLCARGDLQTSDEYDETFAQTSRFAVLLLVMAIAPQLNLKLKHWDIKGAFLCAPIDKDIYLRLPPGYEPPPGKTAKLLKSLYGLRQSSMAFNALLERWLRAYGFVSIGGDKVTFKYEDNTGAIIILSLYVDDGLAATNNDAAYQLFLDALSKEFELNECKDLKWYLGVSITQDLAKGTTFIHQEQYIYQLLSRFSMTSCTPKATPMAPGSRLVKADCPAKGKEDKKIIKEYQQLVGALLYVSAWTRPEITFVINQCAKFMSNPGPTHLVAAKRILRYLKGTSETEDNLHEI